MNSKEHAYLRYPKLLLLGLTRIAPRSEPFPPTSKAVESFLQYHFAILLSIPMPRPPDSCHSPLAESGRLHGWSRHTYDHPLSGKPATLGHSLSNPPNSIHWKTKSSGDFTGSLSNTEKTHKFEEWLGFSRFPWPNIFANKYFLTLEYMETFPNMENPYPQQKFKFSLPFCKQFTQNESFPFGEKACRCAQIAKLEKTSKDERTKFQTRTYCCFRAANL